VGLQVVLATSVPENELAMLREVLDCADIVSEVTSSRDVDTAKPKPDIVHVALRRAGVTADRAVFVGECSRVRPTPPALPGPTRPFPRAGSRR
jgi:phosphoglycolate phosphatase-like HAD superfamily hydrolase